MRCLFLHSMILTRVEGVWDCEVSAVLLLLNLLPPISKGRKSSKISTSNAADHLMKFMKVGGSVEVFLKETGPAQPFLLCLLHFHPDHDVWH